MCSRTLMWTVLSPRGDRIVPWQCPPLRLPFNFRTSALWMMSCMIRVEGGTRSSRSTTSTCTTMQTATGRRVPSTQNMGTRNGSSRPSYPTPKLPSIQTGMASASAILTMLVVTAKKQYTIWSLLVGCKCASARVCLATGRGTSRNL